MLITLVDPTRAASNLRAKAGVWGAIADKVLTRLSLHIAFGIALLQKRVISSVEGRASLVGFATVKFNHIYFIEFRP